MVPGEGIEPSQPQGPRDFKSLASTSSATQARLIIGEGYMLSGNRCQEIHFPARYGVMALFFNSVSHSDSAVIF
jgi:hypothetical protein